MGALRGGPISCAPEPIPLRISPSERQHVVSQAPARVLFCFPPLFVFNCCCGGQLISLPPRPSPTSLHALSAAAHSCGAGAVCSPVSFRGPSPPPPPPTHPLPLMPHHFKWINRATLLFNLAAAELLGGCVRARACVPVCVRRTGGGAGGALCMRSKMRKLVRRCHGRTDGWTEGGTEKEGPSVGDGHVHRGRT